MNKTAMFDFANEQKELWEKSGYRDETYKASWKIARHMLEIAGLWEEFGEYRARRKAELEIEKLEEARKLSEDGKFTYYVLSSGDRVTWEVSPDVKSFMLDNGYWLVAIFENGHRVEE